MQNRTINHEQHKALEGLLFWLREKYLLENMNQCTLQVENNITYQFERLDKLNVPFLIQNLVCNADVHSDILDVLRPNNVKTIR